MCYNIHTQSELYRQEMQPLGRLLEATRKTFVLAKDNNMKRLKHGGYGTRLYSIHKNMKARCYNKNAPNYKYYRMLGVNICDEWLDFSMFREWALENGYNDSLTIDRIDSDGNYDPSNCRWSTKTVQARNSKNRNTTSKSGFIGVVPNVNGSRWVAKIHLNDKPVHIGVYDTKEEAALARDEYVISNGYEHTLNFKRTRDG